MNVTGKMPSVVAAAAVTTMVITGACGVACAGRDDDAAGAVDRRSSAAELADRLGCEWGIFELDLGDEWYGVDARECEAGAIAAQIYGSLDDEDHDRAVAWLTDGRGAVGDESERCGENERGERVQYLVTGPGWVAVVAGEDHAATAADRLGGTVADEPLPNEVEPAVPLRCLPNARGDA